MSTFIIHLIIPPLMALSIRVFPPQYVWAWAWVSVLPDIDYAGWLLYVNDIVPFNTHRAIFHNLFVLFGLMAMVVLGLRRLCALEAVRLREGLRRYAQTRAGAGWMLSSFYYFSHLLLDSFQGGVVPFWPLNRYNVEYYFFLDVNTRTQEVIPTGGVEATPGAPELSPIYRWLDSEQFAFILLLLASLAIGAWHRGRARRVRVVHARLVQPPKEAR